MTATLMVATTALHRLVDQLHRAADEAEAAGTEPDLLRHTIAALGDPGLVQAAGAFAEGWRCTLAEVVDDARRMADVLLLLARQYEAVESANARMFR